MQKKDAPFTAQLQTAEGVLHHIGFKPRGELFTAAHSLYEAGPIMERLFYQLETCSSELTIADIKILICDHLLLHNFETKQAKLSAIGTLRSIIELREENITQLQFQCDSQTVIIQGLQDELNHLKQNGTL